jgi:hypothetical protein
MRNGKSYKEHALRPESWVKVLTEDGSLTFTDKPTAKNKATKRTSKGNAARRRSRAKQIRSNK